MYKSSKTNLEKFEIAILVNDFEKIIDIGNLLEKNDYINYYLNYAKYRLNNEVETFLSYLNQKELKLNEEELEKIKYHLYNIDINEEIKSNFYSNYGLKFCEDQKPEEELVNLLFANTKLKEYNNKKPINLFGIIFLTLGLVLNIVFYFITKNYDLEVRYFYTIFIYTIPSIMISLSFCSLINKKSLILKLLIVLILLYFSTFIALLDIEQSNSLINHLIKMIRSGFDYVLYIVEKMNGAVI